MAHVGPLHDSDAWIVAQGPVELAVTHVDSEHLLSSSLQECVGKSSRRCSGVQAGSSLHPHTELVDSGVQFLTGARHEAFILVDGEGFVGGDARACLGHYRVAHTYAAGQDQTLSPTPALGEASLDEQGVQSLRAPFRATLHASGLTLPVAHEIRQLLQTRGISVNPGERGECPLRSPVRLSPCTFEAEDAYERGLALLGVGTGALA